MSADSVRETIYRR